ncbi:formate dehydrogenase gamma subunit [Noviherbaspirillum humi]|uniref:Formate dehydrogenase gamma subunit n=1 Tax=Noviherbaspirillum humi TaxID=1688639 RepID=A0A239BRC1_9BURK|nr:formate dehydrogenase subunit gamma [Noviherbaspirillum humi]SNS10520.1 formate dehydrogenase gamma subunit [Noviherbaspirillum humi]
MKTCLASLALGAALLTASVGGAFAQEAAKPAAQPIPAAAPAPAVESVDIMKQNQAERSRDQPGNNAPVWRAVKEGQQHYSSLPAPEAGVLIQAKEQFPGQARATSAGEAWRQYRNGPLTSYGGWLLILAVLGIAAVYLLRGQIKLNAPRTGRLIERFTSLERVTHWTMALSFLALALTGLTMLFGKHVLMPLFGHTLFGWLAYACKNVHNFVGPLFTASVIVFFVMFVRDNLPGKGDLDWLKKLGGARGHASAGRFNAGEKIWFWGGVTVLGLIVSGSGFVLDKIVPNLEYTRALMQYANVIHLVAAVLVFAMSLAHIYIGTIGMEGAYDAMRTGYVDDAWAKEHHDLWYEQIEKGEIPRVRTAEGAKVIQPAKAV